MKNFLFITLATLFMTLAVTPGAVAQRIKSYEAKTIAVDTLNNSETINFVYPGDATGLYDLRWHTKVSNVSGTTAGTANLEIANCPDCTDWYTYGSWNIATTSDTLLVVPSFPGVRARIRYVSSGTHVTQVFNHITWLRRTE